MPAVVAPTRPLPMSPVAILGSSLPPMNGPDIVGDASSDPDARPVQKSDSKAAGRILAIDDDSRQLQNFSLALSRHGYSVETADTLAEGLRLAATRPFQVCLLDHNIGYDSGIDALPRLAELAPQMRVVMAS